MTIIGQTVWSFGSSTFVRIVSGDEFAPRFDGKWLYTKDVVLGATLASQSYIDLGAREVGPMTMRIEFTSEALRNTFTDLNGTVGTLANTKGRSYTALLVAVSRVDSFTRWLADATWEVR